MIPRRYARLKSILDRRQPDLTVVTDNVHKAHNVSAIMRTCDAVGVLDMHAVWPEDAFRPEPTSASGSQRYVRMNTYESLAGALDHLEARQFQVVAAHPDPRAVDFRKVDYRLPTAILMGSERDGLSEDALQRVETFIAIPMLGAVASLNVSVAAAIILFEAQRQRLESGMYESCRIGSQFHQQLLFEWAYPRLAAFCKRKGIAYPRLDERGQLLDPLPRG